MDGVDLLVSRGIGGPDHLGGVGWNFGGFMTSWTISNPDRFKAAIAGAAVTDLFAMATTSDIAPSYISAWRLWQSMVRPEALRRAFSDALLGALPYVHARHTW
jgi:dipeptidyl aminopeptidase/acylaminoacyl peptidase